MGRQRGVEGAWALGQRDRDGNLHFEASELCVTVAKSHFAFLGLSLLKWTLLVKRNRASGC